MVHAWGHPGGTIHWSLRTYATKFSMWHSLCRCLHRDLMRERKTRWRTETRELMQAKKAVLEETERWARCTKPQRALQTAGVSEGPEPTGRSRAEAERKAPT